MSIDTSSARRGAVLSAMKELCDDMVHHLVNGSIATVSVPARSDVHFDSATSRHRGGDLVRRLVVETSRRAVQMLQQMCLLLPFLRRGKSLTQRELYYLCKHFYSSYPACLATLQSVSNLLGVSRFHLGVMASSRGSVAGLVRLRRGGSGGGALACWSVGTAAPLPITSAVFEDDFEVEILAGGGAVKCILVVEKEGIFQRLVEDRFFATMPCVVLTAKGFPDLASRALLHKLHAAAPDIPVVGLCDWNPFGLGVLLTYKYGSPRFALDETQWCVPALKWLGMRREDVERRDLAPDVFQPFVEADESRARGLLASEMLKYAPAYRAEVAYMLERRRKLELESIFCSTSSIDVTAGSSEQDSCVTRAAPDPRRGTASVRVDSFERWLSRKLVREEWL